MCRTDVTPIKKGNPCDRLRMWYRGVKNVKRKGSMTGSISMPSKGNRAKNTGIIKQILTAQWLIYVPPALT
jgi:hypothetical protein